MMSNQNIRGTLFPRLLLAAAIVTFLVPWCTLIGDGGVNAHPFVSRVTAYPTSWKSRTKRTTSTAVASTVSKELSTPDLVTNTPDFYTPGAVSYNYVPPFHPAPVYAPFPSGFFPYQPIPPAEFTHSPHLIKVKRKKKKRRLQLSDTSAEAAIKAEEGGKNETSVFTVETQPPQLVTLPPAQPIMYTDLVPEASRYEPLYGLPDVTVPQPGLSEIPPGFTHPYPIYQNPIIATSRAGIPSPVFDLVIEDVGDVSPKRKTRPRRLTRRRKVKNQYFQPQGSLPNTETEPGSLLSSIIPIDTFPGGGSEGESNKYYPSLEPIATASKEEQRSNNPNFWTVARAEEQATTPRRRLRGKKRDRLIITASNNSSETGNSTVSNVKAERQEPDAKEQENEDDLHSSESFNPFLNASVPFSNDLGTSIHHNLDLLHPLFNSDTALKDLSKIPENKTIGIKHKLSDQVLGVKFAPDLHMDFDSKPHHLLNHDSIISSDYERQLYKSRPRIEVKHSVSVSTSSTISSSSSSMNKKQQHKALSTTPMPSITMRDPYTPLLSSHSSSSSASTSSSSGPSRSHQPVEVTSSFSLHQNFFYTTTTPRPPSRDTTLKPQTTINFPITSFTTTDTSTTTGSTVTTYKPTLSPEMMETIKAGSYTTEQPRPVYILSKVTPPAWTTAGSDSSTTFKTPFTLRPKVSTLQPVPTRSYTVLSRKPLPTTLRMMTTTTPRPTTTTTLRTTTARPTTTTTTRPTTTARPTTTTTYRTTTPSTPRTTRRVPTWLTSSTTPSTTTTTTKRTTTRPRTTTTIRHQINTFLDTIDLNSGKNTWTPAEGKSTSTTPRPKTAEKIQINKDPPLILMPPFTTDRDIPPITLTTPDPATRPPSTQIDNETLLLQQLFGIVNEELGNTTPKPTVITTKTTSTRAPTTTKITTTATTKKRTTTTPKPAARTTTAPPTAQADLLNLLNLLGGNNNNNGGGLLGTSNSNNAGGLFGSSSNSGLSGLLGGSNGGGGLFGSNSNNNGGGLGALLGSNGNSNGGGLGALLGSNGNSNGGGLFGSGGLFGGGQSSNLFGGSGGGGLFGQSNNNGGGLFGGLSGLGQATTRRPTTAASNDLFGLLNLLQPTTPAPTTANGNLFNLFNLFGPQTTTTPAPGLGNLLGLFNIFTPAPPVLATTRRPTTVKTTPPPDDILSLLNILNPTSAPKKQSSGSSKDVKDSAQSELDALVQQALLESLGVKSGAGVGQASNVNQQQLPASSSKGLSDADLKSIYDLIDQQGATATTKRPKTITTPLPSSSKTTTLMPIFRNMLNLFGITDPSPSTAGSTTSIPKTTKSSPSTTAVTDSANSSPIPVYNPNSTSQKPKALGTDDLILQILEAEAQEKAKKSESLNSNNSTTKNPTVSPAITQTTAEGNLDILSQLLNLGQAVQPDKSNPVRSNNKDIDELKLLQQQLLQQEQQGQQQRLLQQQKQQQEQQRKLLQQQQQQQEQQQKLLQQQKQQQQSLFQQQQPGAFDIQSLLSQGLLNSATTVRPEVAPSESNIFHILANSFTPRPTNKPNGLYYWVDLNAFMGDAAADPNSGIRPKLGHKDYFIKVKRETSGETTAEPTSLTDSVYVIY